LSAAGGDTGVIGGEVDTEVAADTRGDEEAVEATLSSSVSGHVSTSFGWGSEGGGLDISPLLSQLMLMIWLAWAVKPRYAASALCNRATGDGGKFEFGANAEEADRLSLLKDRMDMSSGPLADNDESDK